MAVFFALRWVLASTTHDLWPVQVSASATFHGNPDYGPWKVVDRSTVESISLRNSWLLENASRGWVRLELGGLYQLETVALLNTRNGLNFDRRTKGYRLELVGPSGSSFHSGELPAYPVWKRHALPGTVASAVWVHIDSHEGNGGGLNEIALQGRPATGLGAHRDTAGALVGVLLLAVILFRAPPRLLAHLTRERVCFTVLTLALMIVGHRLLRFSTAVSIFDWDATYRVTEFDTWEKTAAFFAQLRIPLPPVLTFAEILSFRLTGSIDLMIRVVYKLAIVGGYVIALALVYPRIKAMVATFVLAIVFIASTAAIHPGNPQLYDPILPFLLVLFLLLITFTRALPAGRRRLALLAAAGLTLSMLGLTRPFAIMLLPWTVLLVALQLRRGPRRELVVFAVCAGLLCGPWHLWLLARHGQLTMSNHTGHNLRNGWPMVPMPELIPEDRNPPHRYFNNPQHHLNSRRIQQATLRWMAANPGPTIEHIVQRLAIMTEGKTVILPSRLQPNDDVLWLYRPIVRFLLILALIAGAVRTWGWLRQLRWWRRLAPPRAAARDRLVSAVLVGWTAGSLILMAIGEAGEEARFTISLLPMLALVPRWGTPGELAPPEPGCRPENAGANRASRERS